MNVFRLAGDVSHLVAIIILLLKIWRSKSCAGRLTPLTLKCMQLRRIDARAARKYTAARHCVHRRARAGDARNAEWVRRKGSDVARWRAMRRLLHVCPHNKAHLSMFSSLHLCRHLWEISGALCTRLHQQVP